ncbi:hypothetical protein A2U01_0073214, partial [Trifolium medium]|nr:hypothetical protein [Trifolium medium]
PRAPRHEDACHPSLSLIPDKQSSLTQDEDLKWFLPPLKEKS